MSLPNHGHGHPFSFDAPIRVVRWVQYHVMDGYTCCSCGAPSNIVRVLRMDPEGTARCGTPTLAGQLCLSCAHGERDNLVAGHGFTLDEETGVFHRTDAGEVLRMVDTTAVERPQPQAPTSAQTDDRPAAATPTSAMRAEEIALLRQLRSAGERGLPIRGRRELARRLRERGLAQEDQAPRRRLYLTPFGEQLAAVLPKDRRSR